MGTTKKYLTEAEAATLTGVSAQTLSRFAEAGYLQVEMRDKEGRLFIAREISEVFGIIIDPPSSPLTAASTQEEFVGSETAPTTTADITEQEITEEIPQPVVPPPSDLGTLQSEVTKLKSVVSLQERLLDFREGQLEDLRQQRDWLRNRIERLEEKGDRDQLLLLSETQVIRKLVTAQEQKRSSLRAALEWLGVVEPNTPKNGGTIEMKRERSRQGDGVIQGFE